MVLLSATASHVVYALEQGEEEELSMLVFDCARGKELVFVHIPKNAGTSIENIGDSRGLDWGRFDSNWGRIKERMPDGSMCSHWHVPPALKGPPNPYDDPNAEVFCVTRDPWARMRSEYQYALATHHISPRPWVLDGPRCTVQGFNTWATRALDSMRSGKRYVYDCHLVPQWEFIETPGRKWCHHILPIADLTPRFNQLMQSRGLPMRMKPWSKDNAAGHVCPGLDRMRDQDVYSPAVIGGMRREYKEDFSHLGDTLAGIALFNTSSFKHFEAATASK
jgi:hypothetical protein